MGAYYYVTSPRMVATARVLWDDGRETVETLALYRYAYKPYGQLFDFDGKARAANRRMHFKFGAAACEAAYKRSGAAVPTWGIAFDDQTRTLYPLTGRDRSNRPFATRGLAGGLDDYDFADHEGAPTILEYLTLPAGLTVRAPVAPAEPTRWVRVDNSGEEFGAATSIADLARATFHGQFSRPTCAQAHDALAADWRWELNGVAFLGTEAVACFKDGSKLVIETTGD